MRKLNLGCGQFRKKGYINLDIDKRINPDVLHDLNKIPYPFKNNYFDLIEADHVLEHTENPLAVMRELHRIMKKGSRLLIRVPHFSRGFSNPDHRRGFDVSFPYYFNKKFKGYAGVEFRLVKMRLHWFSQLYLMKTLFSPPVYYTSLVLGRIVDFIANLSPYFCSRIWCFWVGGFYEIEYEFLK